MWIGKALYNIDVREFGSGNAGATNTFRVLGKNAGIPVLAIDILKGSLAVALAYLSGFAFQSHEFINLQLGLGVAALMGHIFPVFAGFRGGKGVATILGIVICIVPVSAPRLNFGRWSRPTHGTSPFGPRLRRPGGAITAGSR